MTAFATADIPAGIDTLEELALWAIATLYEINKGVTYKESAGSSIDSGLAPLTDFSIVSANDGTMRAITRTSFELNQSWVADQSLPLWNFAEPFSNTNIPTAYKAAS